MGAQTIGSSRVQGTAAYRDTLAPVPRRDNGCLRRILVITGCSGEGRLTTPEPDGAEIGPQEWSSPALVWKIRLFHGAQTRLVQNATIAGDAPGTPRRLGTE